MQIKSKWLRQFGERGRELECSNNWEFQRQNSWAPCYHLSARSALGWVYGRLLLPVGKGLAALAQDPRGKEHASLAGLTAMLELVTVLIGFFITSNGVRMGGYELE